MTTQPPTEPEKETLRPQKRERYTIGGMTVTVGSDPTFRSHVVLNYARTLPEGHGPVADGVADDVALQNLRDRELFAPALRIIGEEIDPSRKGGELPPNRIQSKQDDQGFHASDFFIVRGELTAERIHARLARLEREFKAATLEDLTRAYPSHAEKLARSQTQKFVAAARSYMEKMSAAIGLSDTQINALTSGFANSFTMAEMVRKGTDHDTPATRCEQAAKNHMNLMASALGLSQTQRDVIGNGLKAAFMAQRSL